VRTQQATQKQTGTTRSKSRTRRREEEGHRKRNKVGFQPPSHHHEDRSASRFYRKSGADLILSIRQATGGAPQALLTDSDLLLSTLPTRSHRSQPNNQAKIMRIAPREEAKLLLHQAGFLAQKRLARGLQLNQTEAVALIASQLQERIRDGKHSVAELMQHGKTLLGRRHVLPGVPSLLHEIQVEGTFPDGCVVLPSVPCLHKLAA